MTKESIQQEFNKFFKSIKVEDGNKKDEFIITSQSENEAVAEVTKYIHISGWDFKIIIQITGTISNLNIERKFDIIERILLLHID